MKSQKGLTLIEAVVAALIIAVLALIGVQVYNGYVLETRQQTVESLAQTAATAANAFWRKTGSTPSTDPATFLTQTNVFLDQAKYTLSHNSGTKTVTITDKKNNTITASASY